MRNFPSQVVSDAEKISYEYGLKVAQAIEGEWFHETNNQSRYTCLLYTSPSPRDVEESRMPSSA